MEAVLLQSSSQNQQHISPYNRSHVLQNPKRMINNNYSFISRPAFAAENLLPPSNNNIHTGLLQTPPNHLFLSHSSLPPYFPAYGNGGANTNHHLSLSRGLSWPHPINNRSKPSHNNNNNRRSSKDSSLNTAKKSKASASASANNSPKKEDKSKKPTKVVATKAAEAAASEMVKSLGPDTKDLPKVVSSLSSSSMASRNNSISSVGNGSVSGSSRRSVKEEAMEGHHDDGHQMDVFTGSVMFTPSPPPSSLPLPTFSLRPKLSCNAEAAATAAGAGAGGGVDAGATDDLCRLLRLR